MIFSSFSIEKENISLQVRVHIYFGMKYINALTTIKFCYEISLLSIMKQDNIKWKPCDCVILYGDLPEGQ